MATTDPYLTPLTPGDCTVCLIDHQTGTMLGVQDIKHDQFRGNVLALAKAAKLYKVPVVTRASFSESSLPAFAGE